MNSIEKRIIRLEREVRFYRRSIKVLLPLMLLLLFAGFFANEVYEKVVQATRFEVVDDQGEPVVVIDKTGLVVVKNLSSAVSDEDYVHIITEKFAYKVKTSKIEIYDNNQLLGERAYKSKSVVEGNCWSSEITIGGSSYYWNCNTGTLKYMGVTFIGKAKTDDAALQMAMNHFVNVVFTP